MITITEIIACVSGVVESVFGSPPTTKDRTEIVRPCTYVDVDDLDSDFIGELRHDTYRLSIVRFAETNTRTGWANLLTAKANLANALAGYLTVATGFVVYPSDVSFQLSRNDLALECTFTVETFQEQETAGLGVLDMTTLALSRKD